MDIKKLVEKLHPLERRVLPFLSLKSVKKIIEKSEMQEIEVIRALQWLENKDVLKMNVVIKENVYPGKNGKKYLKDGLPEKRFLESLDKELDLDEVKKKTKLNKDEISACLGILKKEKIIEFKGGKIKRIGKWKEFLNKIKTNENFLKSLPKESKQIDSKLLNEFRKRKSLVDIKIEKIRDIELENLGKELLKVKVKDDFIDNINVKILRNKAWKGKRFRAYDIKINVPKVFGGRKHFVNEAIEYVRSIWLEMGFKEMQGNLLQTSFWNFDALFTAQDHPVREMQDTFFIKNPSKGKLLYKELVERVKKTHLDGWTTGSKGWGGKWDSEESRKNVLRTHTTCLSAKTIFKLKKDDLPVKYFSVGRCFRNESVDWSHLFEFNQTEGIVVDPNANFKHLLGYLKEFFKKMGYEKARFRPAYFPYTTCSVEIDVFHPVRKKWIELGGAGIFRPEVVKQWVELGGAGMFRPEVVKPLLGFECPVLAWGLGFPRIIMGYYDINDIRELYKNDLKQLRESKIWLK